MRAWQLRATRGLPLQLIVRIRMFSTWMFSTQCARLRLTLMMKRKNDGARVA
ncbi:hypothetical protein XCY_002681 [Xanthomonas euroxanthea]|uniref:hypothetical protein n=1 Tax=Xanthomonas euroxanthea TaxID=2259622 RepID=UPI001AF32D79|nr:hypothetical protein [Xanthomonas euroxanthea]CAG2092416.1 hypothetical protein XCY_002681 [Xanthomonas euroxanthea]